MLPTLFVSNRIQVLSQRFQSAFHCTRFSARFQTSARSSLEDNFEENFVSCNFGVGFFAAPKNEISKKLLLGSGNFL